MYRTKITEELKKTFNIIYSQYQQNLPMDIIPIISSYAFDLSLLSSFWENFIQEQKLTRSIIPPNRGKIKTESNLIEYFEEIFLTVLKTLSQNENEAISFNRYPGENSTQRTFDTASQALAFLSKDGILLNSFPPRSYNLWDYLRDTGRVSEDSFKDLDVYEFYKEIFLLLPDNQMYAVYRFGPQELKILDEVLNRSSKENSSFDQGACFNQIKNMDLLSEKQQISVSKELYIVREVNCVKLAFLRNNSLNKKLINILNKIPQFLNDKNQIEERQLAPLNILNNLNLLPSVLNLIIAHYSQNYLADLASSLIGQLKKLKSIYDSELGNFFRYSNDLFEPLLAVASDEIFEFFRDREILSVYQELYDSLMPFHGFEKTWEESKEYEYKAIKLIEKFIIGQEFFHQMKEEKYSCLMDGLKNSYPDWADPKLDQFISDLLFLAGGPHFFNR